MANDITLNAAINILSDKAFRDVQAFGQKAERALGLPLGRMARNADEFQKSLAASNARVIAFGASAGLVFGVQKAFAALFRSTIDVEKKLKDINVLLNVSESTLSKFGDSLFTIAKETGQSFKTVSDAAVELSRQGLGMETTLKRTKDALILTRLSGMEAADSVDTLTAALNTFTELAGDSTRAVNILANVDAKFAVSTRDLAEAIKRVGSTAEDTGVSFNSLIALVTSAQQVTARGGSVIGNAFKTIFQRLGRPETLEFLENFQVLVRDSAGEALAADTVLKNLAKRYDTLTGAQKNQVVQLSAGVFQANVFRAVLGDLAKETGYYTAALNEASNATDEAVKRNIALNQTLSAVFNELKQNLAQTGAKIGNEAFGSSLKTGVSTINSILGNFNNADAESMGNKIAVGIFRGIGKFVSGPGGVALGAAFLKLSYDLGKFLLEAGRSLFTINKLSQDRLNINQGILGTEQAILGTLQAQMVARKASMGVNTLVGSNVVGGSGGSNKLLFGNAFMNTPIGKPGFDANSFSQPTFIKGMPRNDSRVHMPGVGSDVLGVLNNEMSRLLPLSQQAGFNLRSAVVHLNKMATNLGLTAAETTIMRESFLSNVRNAKMMDKAQKAILAEITLLSSQALGIFGGSAARTRLAGLAPEQAAGIAAQRQGRIQNIAFGASLGIPILGGMAGEMMASDQTLQGRRAKSLVGAGTDIASYAGMGVMLGAGGGVPGMAVGGGIGAAVGGVMGITKVLMAWNDVLPDLERNLQRMVETMSRTSAQIMTLSELFTKFSYATGPDKTKYANEISKQFSALPPENQSRILSAFRSGGATGVENEYRKIVEENKSKEMAGNLKVFVGAARNKTLTKIPRTYVNGEPAIGNLSITKEGQTFLDDLGEQLRTMGITGPKSKHIESGLKNKVDPSDIIRIILKSMGKTEEADSFEEAMNIIPQYERKFLLQNLLSTTFSPEKMGQSAKNQAALSEILTQKTATEVRPDYNIYDVSHNLSTQLLKAENAGTLYRTGANALNIKDQLGLSRIQNAQDLESGLMFPYLDPIRVAERQSSQRRGMVTEQEAVARRSNIRGLGGSLSEFGLGPLRELEPKIRGNVQEGGKLLEDFTGFLDSLEGFTKEAQSGTIDLPGLRERVGGFRNQISSKGYLTDETLQKSLIDNLNALISKIQETTERQADIGEQAESDKKDLEDKLSNLRPIIERFQTRGGRMGDFLTDSISGRQLAEQTAQIRFDDRRKLGGGADFHDIIQSFTNEFRYNIIDMFDDLDNAAAEVASTMKSGFKGALMDFARGTVSATEALRNFGITVLDKILEKSISMGVDSLVGAGFSAAGAAISSYRAKSNGGLIKGYSSGGNVVGGSGIRDDVPAMLSAGEYVIRKSAVSKYGAGFLQSLNHGGRVGFASGGRAFSNLTNRYDYNNPLRPTSGSLNISSNLSNFALTDENNPQNALRMSREDELYNYIKQKMDYDESNRQAMAAFKQGKKQRIYAAYIGAATNIAGAGISTGIKNYQANNLYRGNNYGGWNYTPTSSSNMAYAANGGLIRHFAAGGSTGRDNVPALLMGGEFVMNRGAVNKYGVDFFNRVNTGSLPKFAGGGFVGNGSSQTSDGSSDKLNDSLMRLINSMDSLKANLEKPTNTKDGKQSFANNTTPSQGTTPFNIFNTINVNMSNGETKTDVSTRTENGQNKQNSQEMSKQIGEQLQALTTKWFIEQSRPGGLVYEQMRR